jgi:2-polyprenyl-3-methyl-5-hydroxy-6-metoxy-1,4-benzoquinol methylase
MCGSTRVKYVPCTGCGEFEHIHVAETFGEGRFLSYDVCGIHYADVAEATQSKYYEQLWAEGDHSCEPYIEKLLTVKDPDSLRRFLEKTPRFQWAQCQLAKLTLVSGILDIGCGEGCLLWAAKNLGLEVHGCDITENAVQLARELLDSENVFVGRVQDLKLTLG